MLDLVAWFCLFLFLLAFEISNFIQAAFKLISRAGTLLVWTAGRSSHLLKDASSFSNDCVYWNYREIFFVSLNFRKILHGICGTENMLTSARQDTPLNIIPPLEFHSKFYSHHLW